MKRLVLIVILIFIGMSPCKPQSVHEVYAGSPESMHGEATAVEKGQDRPSSIRKGSRPRNSGGSRAKAGAKVRGKGKATVIISLWRILGRIPSSYIKSLRDVFVLTAQKGYVYLFLIGTCIILIPVATCGILHYSLSQKLFYEMWLAANAISAVGVGVAIYFIVKHIGTSGVEMSKDLQTSVPPIDKGDIMTFSITFAVIALVIFFITTCFVDSENLVNEDNQDGTDEANVTKELN